MPFIFRQDAESYFNNLIDKKPFETKFDFFYLCLMAGLCSKRKSTPGQMSKTTDLVQYFTKQYKSSQRLILALLIVAELDRLGIDLEEKDEVRKVISNLIDPNDQNNLTDSGMIKMNEYASGGYDYITEQLSTKPYTSEEFLRAYFNVIGNVEVSTEV